MWNPFKYGPSLPFIRLQVWLSWPIIKYGKKLSNTPFLKWLIYPFFKRPGNELTTIPIHVAVEAPESAAIPIKLVERLVSDIDEVFLMDECHCAGVKNRKSPRLNIGCLAFGPSTARIHPSNGRYVSSEEAGFHVCKAAEFGLVANIAHVWIDALAFHLTHFDRLLFMCLCDDDQCIYRSYLKNRGPSLEKAYKKLPGIQIVVNEELCASCETCKETCFVSAITMGPDSAVINDSCVGCAICLAKCPENALSIQVDNEEEMYQQLLKRVREICNLPIRNKRLNAFSQDRPKNPPIKQKL